MYGHTLLCLLNKLAIVILSGAALFGLYLTGRVFVADYFPIPSESMMPTLRPGDVIVVNKTLMGARIYSDFNFSDNEYELECWRTRGLRKIKRGDMVVFNRVKHGKSIRFVINDVFCKRCIGLPGDTVSVVNGHYRCNNYEGQLGVEAEQRRLECTPDSAVNRACRRVLACRDSGMAWTIHNFGPMYIPRKGDNMKITPETATVHKLLLEWETGKKIEIDWRQNIVTADGIPFASHRFSHNCYFMAGDNVLNSMDSRYQGTVPEEFIVGIVGAIIRDKKIIKTFW